MRILKDMRWEKIKIVNRIRHLGILTGNNVSIHDVFTKSVKKLKTKEKQILEIKKTFSPAQKINCINHFYLPIILFPAKFYIIPNTIIDEIKNFIMKFMDPFKAMHFSILSSDTTKGILRNPIKDIEKLNICILLKNYMSSK